MIFILERVSGMSSAEPPVKNDAVFQMHHEGRNYWAVLIDSIESLIDFITRHGEDVIIEKEPIINCDGMICHKMIIYDDYIE